MNTDNSDISSENYAEEGSNAISQGTLSDQLAVVLSKTTPDQDDCVKYLNLKIQDKTLTNTQIAYYKRILNVLAMPDLSEQEGHPIYMVIRKIIEAEFYKGFDHPKSPEIVNEWATFDLFNFPDNHVARRPSDTYFLDKGIDPKNNLLLRPHTSVIWYYYLLEQGGKEKLFDHGEVAALSWGKVYRVDELDKTHHECFFQIDGFRIIEKDKEIITQDHLKEAIIKTIQALFGEEIEYRFLEDDFPYTTDSLQVEVMYDGKRMEVLGGGIVHPTVFKKLGIDPDKYNGWAYGFGLDRLAMAFKGVPDIRIMWSEDERITKQWGNFEPYEEISKYPPITKDISFITPKTTYIRDEEEEKLSGELELTKDTENNFFSLTGVVRDVAGDLIEEVKIVDMYENDKKFGDKNKSVSIRIVFRSIERTLIDDEINKLYFQIRDKMINDLGYELR